MADSCVHDELQFQPGAEALGETTIVTIRCRCAACGTFFSWQGVVPGVANPAGPVVSADGFELRAPVAPRPGAYVELLEQAGIADQLTPPPTE
jgi:hypothetical protein